jgi:hypothetical protein
MQGKQAMFKQFSALVLGALVVTCVLPASAQSPQGTSIGSLSCKMAAFDRSDLRLKAANGMPFYT